MLHHQEKLNAKRLHREQFWGHLNREEILLHDRFSWRKLAQLEENLVPSNQVVAEMGLERKREAKKVDKSVRRALKWGKNRSNDNLKSCEKEKKFNDVYEKALVSLQAAGCSN